MRLDKGRCDEPAPGVNARGSMARQRRFDRGDASVPNANIDSFAIIEACCAADEEVPIGLGAALGHVSHSLDRSPVSGELYPEFGCDIHIGVYGNTGVRSTAPGRQPDDWRTDVPRSTHKTPKAEADEPAPALKGVRRALEVLEYVAVHPGRAIDIADGLGLSWATLHRTLSQLEQGGLLQRARDSNRYSIGPRMWLIGTAYLANHPVLEVAQPTSRPPQETRTSRSSSSNDPTAMR